MAKYWQSLVGTSLAVIMCAGLLMWASAEEPARTGDEESTTVILSCGDREVQLPLPASWQAQEPQSHPDDAVSLLLSRADPRCTIIVKVKPVTVELSLDALRRTLDATLKAYPLFELTESRSMLLSGIPAIMFGGTLQENDRRLGTRIYVFCASDSLWEMVLTAPPASCTGQAAVMAGMVAGLRVRPSLESQWAKLTCSQESLLAYKASRQPQGPASGSPEGTKPSSPGAIIRDLDSCLNKVAIGTRLDANNELVGEGQQFPADSTRLVIYLVTEDAPADTEVTVELLRGDRQLLRRRLRLGGSRKFAVTVAPRDSGGFRAGAYLCRVRVNGELAWEIPVQVGD